MQGYSKRREGGDENFPTKTYNFINFFFSKLKYRPYKYVT